MELDEHGLVIDTLKEADETLKCYRMVGGVLVEADRQRGAACLGELQGADTEDH